jgi:hypothetical protein
MQMLKNNLLFIFMLSVLSLGTFRCELIDDVCHEKETDPRIIQSKYLSEDFIVETVQLEDSMRFIQFRFTEFVVSPDVVLSFDVDDVCTSSQFYAEVRIHIKSDYLLTFPDRMDPSAFKILAWYPSVYPSKKDFYAVGNRLNGKGVQLKLPRASKEYHSPAWVELGVELRFKGENDLAKDLAILQNELNFIEFQLDYVKY